MAPKKAAKARAEPKGKAKAKAKAKAAAEPAVKKEPTPEERLKALLDEFFSCYDKDEDGQLERVEWLEGEEKRLGKHEFGPRQRKQVFQWFKDSGAEGSPSDGMYLSRDKWEAAMIKLCAEESEIGADKPAELAEWILENKAKPLFRVIDAELAEIKHTSPEEIRSVKDQFKALDANGNGVLELVELQALLVRLSNGELKDSDAKALFDGINKSHTGAVTFDEFFDYLFAKQHPEKAKGAVPSYPLTIDFKELKTRLDEAASIGRNVLVLASGKAQVATFFQYQNNLPLDCKQMIAEIYVSKTKTNAEWQEKAKETLMTAMNSSGFCRPIFAWFGNSAFDWKGFCSDDGFPADVFASKEVWTIEKAFEMKLIDDGQKFNLSVEEDKKWKDFQIQLVSEGDLDFANQHLFDKIPHYDDLAILVVDPKSID
eukprot:TRINITY_DN16947_c0_g1_i1.p1 TRINITY_DN16947_c0_g1~~TRINITY_DN16947_c0_g1_i1.p1  ORF type:complete len:429 (-),score=128.89 TRINITY_DN16947_c0_g1_i1:144-1430(-)